MTQRSSDTTYATRLPSPLRRGKVTGRPVYPTVMGWPVAGARSVDLSQVEPYIPDAAQQTRLLDNVVDDVDRRRPLVLYAIVQLDVCARPDPAGERPDPLGLGRVGAPAGPGALQQRRGD